MNTVQSALEKARSQAQDLHKNMEISALQDQVAMRAEMARVAAKTLELRQSLSGAQNGNRAAVQQHIQAAQSALDEASTKAKAAATAGAADLKKSAEAVRERTRQAVQQLTDAVAAERSKVNA